MIMNTGFMLTRVWQVITSVTQCTSQLMKKNQKGTGYNIQLAKTKILIFKIGLSIGFPDEMGNTSHVNYSIINFPYPL